MTFLDRLNLPKFDFTQNRSDGNIIKFQQSQALNSHFESFWSIVKELATLCFINNLNLASKQCDDRAGIYFPSSA